VIGVDLMDDKLDFAEEQGAVETVNAAEVEDPAAEVRAITDGGADVSMDALGIETTCRNAVKSLGKTGQHVQVGLTTKEAGGTLPLPTDEMVTAEIDFLGAHRIPPER
jgi:alcohol dehydrogenase